MSQSTLIIAMLCVAGGLLLGWLWGQRGVARARADRDAREADFKRAIIDLARAEERLKAQDAAKDTMTAQFGQMAAQALDAAQSRFLERADARLKQSEDSAGQNLKALLQPVSDRLQRYEEGVHKVEAERRDAFGNLAGLIEAMRVGQEKVSSEAAKLVNSLRNAPKARGRWGEQQLRNVLETCGLAEHTDFQTEVSVATGDDGARLRPDAVVRVPGGRSLVIDAKVSLNAYQDAFGTADEDERTAGLSAHAAAMRAHVNGLGNKSYWSQFPDTPDFVVMFIPGEHFLSAALEHDPDLWEFAFAKRVLMASPTNLVAIAKTVAGVWRQERLAADARKIGELGRELHDRLAKAMGDLKTVGTGLNTAVRNYNQFVNSMESRALVTARKLKDLNIEPGAREIEEAPAVELLASHAGDGLEPVGPTLIAGRDVA